MSDFTEALTCAERALGLARDLDKVRGPGDLAQISSGIVQELDCVVQRLSDGLDAIRKDAAGDRPGKVRNDALRTSEDAGRLVLRPGTQRASVLLALYRWGDLSDFEIQERLEMDQNSERPRRGELVDAQLVAPALAPTAEGSTSITRRHNGRDWQVWRLTSLGVTAAEQLAGVIEERPASAGQPQSLF